MAVPGAWLPPLLTPGWAALPQSCWKEGWETRAGRRQQQGQGDWRSQTTTVKTHMGTACVQGCGLHGNTEGKLTCVQASEVIHSPFIPSTNIYRAAPRFVVYDRDRSADSWTKWPEFNPCSVSFYNCFLIVVKHTQHSTYHLYRV